MMSDGRILPKFLSPMPLTYEAPTVPANRLFPKRSYKKVPRESSQETDEKLPVIKNQQGYKKGNRSNANHNSHSLAPLGSIERPQYSPAIQRPKNTQKLRDNRTPSLTEQSSQAKSQANLQQDKQYASLTESIRLNSEQTTTEGMLLQKWDDDKVFDHPIHRMLNERMEKLYREEKLTAGFSGRKTRISPHNRFNNRHYTLGMGLKSRELPSQYSL